MKVLIVEKNAKPGGYCTSFKRGGFAFDACVHSLGSLREDGILRTILRELDIEKRLEIKRNNPSDIIITPDFKIHFWNDLGNTIKEFQGHFPKEANKIEEFFNFIINCQGITFSRLASLTFQSLLDRYFNDEKLKAVLSLLLLGNAGLPAKQLSATVGVYIYKEFMFDGGYYPDCSIQSFPDILVARYKEFGGDIIFSSTAKKIKLQDNKVEGVELVNKGFIPSKYVISNADATQTYTGLIGKELIGEKTANKLKSMVPSHSAFILYLGTDGQTKNIPKDSM
ncbi:MAG: NAD(P)/FAD-dependent oxidoreductase [Nitrospirae bacterium]|nr:NAD(P)/FAD-dependent oxidoreductase [Nitrospirota bacterium]